MVQQGLGRFKRVKGKKGDKKGKKGDKKGKKKKWNTSTPFRNINDITSMILYIILYDIYHPSVYSFVPNTSDLASILIS